MPRRLAPKLIFWLTIIVIVIEVIFGYVSLRTQERRILDTMILGADQLSRGIASATWHAMLADNREAAYQVMQTIAEKHGIDRIRIFNKEGRIMFSTNAGDENRQVDKAAESCSLCHAAMQPLVAVDVPTRARIFRNPDGGRKLAMVTPIYNEPACSNAACHAHPVSMNVLGVLDVALDLDPVDQELAATKLRVLLVSVFQVVLISVFIFLFARRFVSAPIRRLIEGTQAVSEMNLDKPIEIVHSSEELDHLAHSFNIMRERLSHAMTEVNEFTQDLENKVQRRTEQLKAAHLKLLQTDRLASLGHLSASVAHEINNPISGVLNLSMLMQRVIAREGQIPPNRLEEFRKYLGQVVSETSRVGRIVSDLLAFSRRSKPQRIKADLNKIVNSTLSLASHKLRLSNVDVDTSFSETLPPVPCDTSQIQQVVLNLLLNAAEATHNSPEKRIWVSTCFRPESEAVQFQVRDSGEGIRQENLAKIFDPFFTTKPEGKGVGLGLAVSYGIIEAHGGDIAVASELGHGTTFTVTLPLSNGQPPAA